MKIFKVISNNVVSVKDGKGKEILLKGLSIGYKKKPGEDVDEDRIEKKFVIEDEVLVRRFDEMSMMLNKNLIDVCVNVIDEIKEKSKFDLSDSLYITVIDHMNGLLERMEDHIAFDNSILWDLKRLYPEEYKLAKYAVGVFQEKVSEQITDDEANFITLHIINSEKLNDMSKTLHVTNMIHDISDIISWNMESEIDTDDYYYNRLIMHVRFLLENIGRNSNLGVDTENVVLSNLVREYPQCYSIVEKICEYIKLTLDHRLNNEEKLYLMIHFVQIFNKNRD